MKGVSGISGGGELPPPVSHKDESAVDKETGILATEVLKQTPSTDAQAPPPISEAKTEQEVAQSNPMLSALISKIESFINTIGFFIDLTFGFVGSTIGSAINEGMNRFDELIRELNGVTKADELKQAASQETGQKNQTVLMEALKSGELSQIREARKNIPVPRDDLNLTANEESVLKSFRAKIGDNNYTDNVILGNLSSLGAEVLDQRMVLDDNVLNYSNIVTPLHLSILNDRSEVTKALIANGVHLETGDREGKTALMLAIEKKDVALMKTLVEAGADPNTQATNGETALILAVKLVTSGHDEMLGREMLSYLMQNGANKNIKDNDGNSAAILSDRWYASKTRNSMFMPATLPTQTRPTL